MTAAVVALHGVHPIRPEINGRGFSDIAGMGPAVVARLCAEGMIFTTTFSRNGKLYGGDVIARDWDAAQSVATARGFGEEVTGQLVEVIPLHDDQARVTRPVQPPASDETPASEKGDQ